MDLLPHLLAAVGFFALILLSKRFRPSIHNPHLKARSAPEPAGPWPVLGHLPQLNSHATLARTLGALADKYGPVFTIRIGMTRALVVSNWESVKECFTTNDIALASRPDSNAGTYLGYNSAGFGFAPYGPFWREMRKLVVLELLSHRRLEMLQRVRISEIEINLRELFLAVNGKTPAKVVMSEWFEELTLNVIVKTIAGKRYSETEAASKFGAHKFRKLVREYMEVSGELNLGDVIPHPYLRWLDFRAIRRMKRISKELDAISQMWIDEHTEKTVDSKSGDEQDFIDVVLSAIKGETVFGHSRHTLIKATILTLIIAGSDTTSIHLTWVLSLLLNNGHIMKQAQDEIDKNVGKERWVEESDIKNLVFLQTIVMEALRLYPPGPLSVPHVAREDIEVSGYHVPKGTRIFTNLWKLHRDPRIWSEPDKFMPERFMTSHSGFDVSGKHFEFTPFGTGRRACPGMTFAMQLTHLTLARLLQGFDLTTASNLPVDMSEGQGITLPKRTPLETLIIPRLPEVLYMGH